MLFNHLLHILLAIVFLLTYILAYNYVRPFRLNRKRLLSTLFFKISYMIFLLFLLTFIYLFLLFGANRVNYQISDLLFFLILILLFLPNIAILLRRRVKYYRISYNYIFFMINLAATYYIIDKLIQNKWFL